MASLLCLQAKQEEDNLGADRLKKGYQVAVTSYEHESVVWNAKVCLENSFHNLHRTFLHFCMHDRALFLCISSVISYPPGCERNFYAFRSLVISSFPVRMSLQTETKWLIGGLVLSPCQTACGFIPLAFNAFLSAICVFTVVHS